MWGQEKQRKNCEYIVDMMSLNDAWSGFNDLQRLVPGLTWYEYVLINFRLFLFSVSRPKLICLLWHASLRLMWRFCLVTPTVWSLWLETKFGNIPKFYVMFWVVLFGCQRCFSCKLSRKNVALKVCVFIDPFTCTRFARNYFYVVYCWKW